MLLVGPRGSGKTSTARILAAMLNTAANAKGGPYQDPSLTDELVHRIFQGNSLAVHELDAASHRGIDDVRALKEQVYLPPQEGAVNVFILDEVHMFTTEAFNALLKLLEEPPAQVVFILATTEEHKVPATIVSRCTVIRFQRASADELNAALAPLISAEKLQIEPSALDLIISAADGSFRDAVKLLETSAADGNNITAQSIQQQLHAAPITQFYKLIHSIVSKDEHAIVQLFNQLRQDGRDEKTFFNDFMQYLHQQLLLGITAPEKTEYAKKITQYLLTQFLTVDLAQSTPIPLLALELKALEIIFKAQEKGTPPLPPKVVPTAPVVAVSVQDSAPSLELSPAILPIQISGGKEAAESILGQWSRFIAEVEGRNSSLAAVLRSANPSCHHNGTLCIEVFYQFHRDQLRQPKFVTLLEQAAQTLTDKKVLFEFMVHQGTQLTHTLSNVAIPPAGTDQLVQLAQEVFL